MDETKMYFQGRQVIVKKVICYDPEKDMTISMPVEDLSFREKSLPLFVARKATGKLLLFTSKPQRSVMSRQAGRYHNIGTWEPSHGWCNELVENNLHRLDNVTWEGGARQAHLSILEIEEKK